MVWAVGGGGGGGGYRRLSDSSLYIDEIYKSLKSRKFPLNRTIYVILLYMHSTS